MVITGIIMLCSGILLPIFIGIILYILLKKDK